MAYNFEKVKKEFGDFIRQYHRKRKNTCDPNDRGYDRKIEEKIKRMKPEELNNAICDEDKDYVSEWPFDDPENVAVFTSIHIMKERKPILHVAHDEDDGAWQFHSGQVTKMEDSMIVSLREVFDIDNTISSLVNLPLGYIAERNSVNDDWKVYKKESV